MSVIIAVLFGMATIAIAHHDRRGGEDDQVVAWALGGLCTLLVVATKAHQGDPTALLRGFGSATALGLLPLSARMMHRDGIDATDVIVSAFTGFVLGASSWTLAWKVMLGSVALSGLVALINLAKQEQTTRVPFAFVVAGFASVAAIRTALW